MIDWGDYMNPHYDNGVYDLDDTSCHQGHFFI